MRRTKIVATIGPATSSKEQITALIKAGMNVARLNFSHGTHEEHAERIRLIREVADELTLPIAILQDLQGPKIRTGPLKGAAPIMLQAGERLVITTRDVIGEPGLISTTYDLLPGDVKAGDRLLLSDGLIELRCLSSSADEVVTEVVSGGMLREHQGINLPGVAVSAPSMTEKDYEDLKFGLAQDVDYVALSFVRRPQDVLEVRSKINEQGKRTPVIAKIEKPEAVSNIKDIILVSDGVMVARGDLGVEMPPEQVPLIQKAIIDEANRRGIPVITATQMLESMIQNPRPTRAEASDVANAIIDGTDAVMLSGETATGKYPIEAVSMMARIALVTEARTMVSDNQQEVQRTTPDAASHAISNAACTIARSIPIVAIVAFTQSGYTAHLVAKNRPNVPIFAMTPNDDVYRRLALVWGIRPLRCPFVDRLDTLSNIMREELLRTESAKIGDLVVVTGGHPLVIKGHTNFLKIMKVEAPKRKKPAED
jgi:pyruvate kinase